MRRKLLILAAAVGIFFLLVIAAGVAVLFSPLLTRDVEGDAFRVAMEEETAKGLHFPRAHYAPIRRTGAFTAQSESFDADNGQKAMKSLVAHGITAKFDPWGAFLRQFSQRIIELFKESPGAYLGLLFRQFGDWLKKTFGGD